MARVARVANDLVAVCPWYAVMLKFLKRLKEHRPVAAVNAHSFAGRGLLDFQARTVGSRGAKFPAAYHPDLLAPMIHRYCISHKKPLLPESWYDDCIALGDFQSDSVFHVRQLDRFWHEARPIAYGAAGSHVLPIAIERFSSGAKLIEISSYRKRILPSPEGTESRLYPTLRESDFENFGKEAELSV